MVLLQNTSTKTVIHEEGDQLFRIESKGGTLEVMESVADAIMSSWKGVQIVGTEKTSQPEPWEFKAGDAWNKAKEALGLSERKTAKKTVGADRPEVKEPAVPKDAILEGGRVDEKKLNDHLCPTCKEVFKSLKGCRTHQAKVHGT